MRAGVTVEGQEVHAYRGFRVIDEEVVWERVED